MFNLTKQEQTVVAFLMGAILLGIAVKEWRLRHPRTTIATIQETRER